MGPSHKRILVGGIPVNFAPSVFVHVEIMLLHEFEYIWSLFDLAQGMLGLYAVNKVTSVCWPILVLVFSSALWTEK